MPDLWLNILDEKVPIFAGKKTANLGCLGCPQNKRVGLKKIFGEVVGRRAMLWAQSPGELENQKGRELIGPSGQWLWKELDRVGLTRDMFDIQNVLRCRPVSGEGRDREPTSKELRHCSVWNDRAIADNAGKANVWLVFGAVAQKQLLRSEYRKSKASFWSEKHDVRIFQLDHPAYFLRQDGSRIYKWKLEQFRRRLSDAVEFLKVRGKWGWLEAQDFRLLDRVKSVRKMVAEARASGERVAVDIEDGMVNGKRRVLVIGFSWRRRSSRIVVIDHPESRHPGERDEKLAVLKEFLEDSRVKKIFHYGAYDVPQLLKLVGIKVRGYTWDTTYANYLKNTWIKKHGLEAIADTLYPAYAGYKHIIDPYLEGRDFAAIPLEVMRLYNGADAALTKEIELDTRDEVPQPLMLSYIRAGFTLAKMEQTGPAVDLPYLEHLEKLIPPIIENLTNKLRMMSGKPKLNPNKADDIAKIIYRKFKLPPIEEDAGESTEESVLNILYQEHKHPFIPVLLDYRKFSKMYSTYVKAYRECVKVNGGQLRTRWYLTGAATGRLRSGGKKDGIAGVVNMQNLHGSTALKNLLVSDTNWRRILSLVNLDKYVHSKTGLPDDILDLEVFLAADYSQIEIRMLAEVSGDPGLVAAFNSGADIHCAVGHDLTGKSHAEIKSDKDLRSFIKNCHFGLVYGLSEEGLFYYLKAKGIKTTEKKAAKFHRDYFRKYKKVKAYIEKMRAMAERDGFVKTIFGFKRLIGIEEDRTTNPENQAVNSPIQGAAHQLMLMAMGMLMHTPGAFPLLQDPVMEVHDALVLRVKLRDLPAAYKQIEHLLEHGVPKAVEKLFGFKLKVPLKCEVDAGFRYGAMVPEYNGKSVVEFLKDWLAVNKESEEKALKSLSLAA